MQRSLLRRGSHTNSRNAAITMVTYRDIPKTWHSLSTCEYLQSACVVVRHSSTPTILTTLFLKSVALIYVYTTLLPEFLTELEALWQNKDSKLQQQKVNTALSGTVDPYPKSSRTFPLNRIQAIKFQFSVYLNWVRLLMQTNVRLFTVQRLVLLSTVSSICTLLSTISRSWIGLLFIIYCHFSFCLPICAGL
jgi:hypothetical protein